VLDGHGFSCWICRRAVVLRLIRPAGVGAHDWQRRSERAWTARKCDQGGGAKHPDQQTNEEMLIILDTMFDISYIGAVLDGEKMPYREKTAWLSLLAMVVTFGPYFTIIATRALPSEPMPNLGQLRLFAVTAIVQMLILGVGHLYIRRGSKQEARIPPDERDEAIMRRSVSSAYYVLIAGMILVGCVMPFGSSGWSIINAAVFMIIAAELVHYGVVVFSYRRQA